MTQRKLERLSLGDLYRLEGRAGLDRLAAVVNARPEYLRQCANGPRTPSPSLAFRLVQADPRLDFVALFEHAKPSADETAPRRVRRWAAGV